MTLACSLLLPNEQRFPILLHYVQSVRGASLWLEWKQQMTLFLLGLFVWCTERSSTFRRGSRVLDVGDWLEK